MLNVHVYYQEYIIKEKRVSNAPIRSVECVRKVMPGMHIISIDVVDYVRKPLNLHSKRVTFHTHSTLHIGKFDTLFSFIIYS